MQKLDYFQAITPLVYISPKKKVSPSKIANFFLFKNKNRKEINLNEQDAQVDPTITTSRTKYSVYQKFLGSVDTPISQRRPVQCSFSQKKLLKRDDTTKEFLTEEVPLQQHATFYTSPPIYLPLVKNHNSLHESQSGQSRKYQTQRFVHLSSPKNDLSSPKNEQVGKLKPLKIMRLEVNQEASLIEVLKSPFLSCRSDRRVQKNLFSQPLVKNSKSNEENFTSKLRKSLTAFQNNKLTIGKSNKQIPQNKITRAFSQLTNQQVCPNKRLDKNSDQLKKCQSQDRIKILELFEEKKQISIGKNASSGVPIEYKPSMVERNLSKKINLTNRLQIETELVSESIIEQSKIMYQEKSISPLVRQRFFSIKPPGGTLMKQHFAIPIKNNFDDSKDILLNLHQKLQGPYMACKPSDMGSLNSMLIFSPQNHQQISNSARANSHTITSYNSQNLNDPHLILPSFPVEKPKPLPKFLYQKDTQLNFLQDQISQKLPDTIESTPNNEVKGQRNINFSNYNQKPDNKRNEHILDLLLLSTCELKKYFNPDQPKSCRSLTNKVKIASSKQQFPGDFFNVLN